MTTTDRVDINDWIASQPTLMVVALDDPSSDGFGHDVRSSYVETYWLPLLGPSALWAARRLGVWLEADPAGFEVPLESLSRSLGLGRGTGRQSPIVRTLARLAHFGMANADGFTYAARRRFPSLTPRHINRLPECLVLGHDLEEANR
jgi:hypothetical protein